jgi:hypothetical protein
MVQNIVHANLNLILQMLPIRLAGNELIKLQVLKPLAQVPNPAPLANFDFF